MFISNKELDLLYNHIFQIIGCLEAPATHSKQAWIKKHSIRGLNHAKNIMRLLDVIYSDNDEIKHQEESYFGLNTDDGG